MRFMTTSTVEGETSGRGIVSTLFVKLTPMYVVERMMQIAKKKLVLDHLIVSRHDIRAIIPRR
jgi:hypothetical protein